MDIFKFCHKASLPKKVLVDFTGIHHKHEAILSLFRKVKADSNFLAVQEEITKALHLVLLFSVTHRSETPLVDSSSLARIFGQLKDSANLKLRRRAIERINNGEDDENVLARSIGAPSIQTEPRRTLLKTKNQPKRKRNKPKASVLIPWRDLRYSY